MKIFVINLKTSTKRFERIKNNLDNLNLSFERFDAVNGKQLSKDELNNHTTIFARTLLCNRQIIGCALSHLSIWKKFLYEIKDDDLICVAEDDAQFNDKFPILLKNAEMIFKETNFDFLNLNCGGISSSFQETISITSQDGNLYEISKPIFPTLTTSYIISKKGVKRILDIFDKINYHIDFELACKMYLYDLQYFALISPIILENTCEDSIINGNMNGVTSFLLQKLNLHKLNWVINSPCLTLFLDFPITIYNVILILGMIFAIKFKFWFLFLILFCEMILNYI